MKKGLFITFEGIDACGKSTQIVLLDSFLQKHNFKTLCLRDPGATIISEKIRNILLDKQHDEMSSFTELLLYEAARAQMVEQFIKPALNAGTIVLSDRFFDSTTAYQGYGRGLALDLVEKANEIGSCGLTPDLTFVVDLPVEQAVERKAKLGDALDRLESAGRQFQKQVRQGFLEMAAQQKRFVIIDGNAEINGIHTEIQQQMLVRFKEYFDGDFL